MPRWMFTMDRKDMVHDKMVTRWAYRWLEIRDKHGPKQAELWADNFLNSEDVPRVAEAVSEILRGKG